MAEHWSYSDPFVGGRHKSIQLSRLTPQHHRHRQRNRLGCRSHSAAARCLNRGRSACSFQQGMAGTRADGTPNGRSTVVGETILQAMMDDGRRGGA